MIPARTPEQLETAVRNMSAHQPLRGFLLSGGSNVRNEVRFEAFLPVVKRLKSEFGLRVAVHTGLVDARRAAWLADAGIDVAMLDIIGAPETIREVYNFARPVADFEARFSNSSPPVSMSFPTSSSVCISVGLWVRRRRSI